MELHENSHLHRCCVCVIMTSWSACCWKTMTSEMSVTVWVCRCGPFLSSGCRDTHTHTHMHDTTHTGARLPLPHMSTCMPVLIHLYPHMHTGAPTHQSISQTVQRQSAGLHTQGVWRPTHHSDNPPPPPPHDSTQGICPVTSKHALCRQGPRKTCLSCCPLRVMCSPTRRSKSNYSASQRPPFIFPFYGPTAARKWSEHDRENLSQNIWEQGGGVQGHNSVVKG